MYAFVDFFGGPAWTAVVALGAILAILTGIDASKRKFTDRTFYIVLFLTLYFLVVLFVRGAGIFLSSL